MSAANIHDVAKAAGVSVGTVSRALNERANVAPATREKVLRAAEQLGYRPNKLLAGLASSHFRRKSEREGFPIAMVSWGGKLGKSEEGWARDAALRQGFDFHFVDASQAGSGAALSRELFHRGMAGLLFWRVLESGGFWDDFDFRPFSLVSVHEAFSVARPGINLVRHTPFNGMLRAWDACKAAGHLRVSAILFDPLQHQPHNIRLLAAANHCLTETPADDRIAPFRITSFDKTLLRAQTEQAVDWIRENRLDAVILASGFLREISRRAKCPYAMLGGATPGETGFCHPMPKVLDTAFWLLDLLVRSRKTGLIKEAGEMIVNGEWQEGRSLLPNAWK